MFWAILGARSLIRPLLQPLTLIIFGFLRGKQAGRGPEASKGAEMGRKIGRKKRNFGEAFWGAANALGGHFNLGTMF